jgi:hypothetical protein
MRDLISAETQTLCWMAIFFFGSAAASSAYLTVSETFPLEIRALAIAFFYAVGTAIGGIVSPLAVRGSNRYRIARQRLRRLSFGGSADDRWWACGVALGRRRRTKSLEMVARPLTFIS